MHKIFKRARRQRLKILSVVGDTAYNFLAYQATALTIFKRTRRQRLKFVSVVGDSANKYKMAIFRPKPSKFIIFWPSS